ncbi:hypothetical protein [Rhizobium sp. RU36D]|uniref:hypothetical protein n=1 Tax=Rhizobium sp. RU36D TaxID=1907415 RepID=UPI0009D7C8EF|nr:hypothetical protein [Rhizobium sp. RU36D]SMD10765.1 hypothetical protein SAMN05880593_12212 [Rhizobium sp. RU36D]
MDDEFDIGLFRPWPVAADGEREGQEARLARLAHKVVLELKSAEALSPLEAYGQLLNELTLEMREQFALFRKLRETAEGLIDGGDEAAGKQARADAKAATDAMALIVRTLEKVDSLQRQLARDRAEAQERAMGGEDVEEITALFHRTIDERANERAKALLKQWQREAADADCFGPAASGKAIAADAAPGAGGP